MTSRPIHHAFVAITLMLLTLLGACGGGGNTAAIADAVPSIRTQPAATSISEGQTATFSVVAAGSEDLSYQWQRNGAVVAGAVAASYTTPPVTLADNGSVFTVTISNALGSVTSGAATLTVGDVAIAPTVTAQPADVGVTVGQTASFAVGVSGTGPLTYQWLRDGVPIAGATGNTYVTAALGTPDNGASYSVVVSNAAGTVTSAAAVLSVTTATVAPLVAAPPLPSTVNAGQTATFSVIATGTAPLTFQWRRNGVDIAGATGASHTTATAVAADNGAVFSVTVANAAGSVTSAGATLTVSTAAIAPSITAQPAGVSVTEGQVATFSVAATGTAPLTYQWRKNGIAVAGATSASYTIPAAVATDSGASFSVIVANAAGSVVSNAATLTVGTAVSAPTIVTQPASATVTVGQAASFTVNAAGSAPLAYQWRKNGVNVTGANGPIYMTPVTNGVETGALFSVVVSNTAGSVTSANATLTVVPVPVAPSITNQPASITVNPGLTASFGVSASGSGPLSYQWRRNGSEIVGATAANYTTPVNSAGDSGAVFTVVVTNPAGSVTSSPATLTVSALAWAGIRQDGAPLPRSSTNDNQARDSARGMATDALGQVVIVGDTSGYFDVADSDGVDAAFVAKYSAAGQLLWGRRIRPTSTVRSVLSSASAVAVDTAGQIYVLGSTNGQFTGEIAYGSSDVFVAKLDADGAVLWVRQFGTSDLEMGDGGIAVSSTGEVLVASTLARDASATTYYGPYAGAFVAKFDASGNRLWIRNTGLTAFAWQSSATDVGVDSSGNVFATGHADNRGFVVKFDSAGTQQWISELAVAPQGTPYAQLAVTRLAVAGNGNAVYLTGRTNFDFDDPSNPLAAPSETSTDAFLVRFDGATGARQWAHNLSSVNTSPAGPAYFRDFGLDVAVNADASSVYISGYTQSGTMPGATFTGRLDVYVAGYSADGGRRWVKQFSSGSQSTNAAYAVAVDLNGDVFAAGAINGPFGTPGHVSMGSDWFVLKLAPADGSLY